MKRILAIVLTITISAALAIPTNSIDEKIEYTNVLVHGLGGWGETSDINNLSPYWGSKTGNLAEHLIGQGYDTVEASVGPFSSTWDRTCELYAQLTGTTVDYGEAHSVKHNHNRYGKSYANSLVAQWDETHQLNLVGHSFGGETVRMLASLMAYGDTNEQETTKTNISPLFTGNKKNYVHSVTTLCSPHNGTTLYYIVDSVPFLVKTLLKTICVLSGVADYTKLNKFYDINLGQFSSDVFKNGLDNAGYELSPEGAAELNKSIKTVDSIYYFSYSFESTHSNGRYQEPDQDILPVLYLTSASMGLYKSDVFSPINDGLVNVNSARYPWNEAHTEFNENNIQPGIWNVMPTMKGHHGTIIGMDGNTDEIHNFYIQLCQMIGRI